MFLLPRLNPLIALAFVTGLILALVVGLDEIVYTLSGVVVHGHRKVPTGGQRKSPPHMT